MLITQIQSGEILLSEGIAKSLDIANRIKDKKFESFCRNELIGFHDTSEKLHSINEENRYRLVNMHVSTINLNKLIATPIDVNEIFRAINQSNKFKEKEFIFSEPISRIEDLCTKMNNQNAYLSQKVPMSYFFPEWEKDTELFFYTETDQLFQLKERIRAKLITFLLGSIDNSK